VQRSIFRECKAESRSAQDGEPALTGQPLERVHEDMDRDRYFTAEQAREYGLVDRVISSHELSRVATGFGSREEEAAA